MFIPMLSTSLPLRYTYIDLCQCDGTRSLLARKDAKDMDLDELPQQMHLCPDLLAHLAATC